MIFHIFLFICGAVYVVSAHNDKKVEEYVQSINEFLKSTENFIYPTDSKEFLNGQNEDIINNCQNAGTYDFIVVGAGSSGSVVASRLSEIEKWRVLLIEAGGPETEVLEIPALVDYLRLSRFNWGYKSTPQTNSLQGYLNHTEIIARGKALGGSSAINYMAYVRGHREDYNLWSSLGNSGWSYKDVLPYFKKSEHTHIYHPDPGYHGFHGPLNTEQMNILSPLSYAFLLANQELGTRVLDDYNGQREKGASVFQTTMKFGRRDSGARAFLTGASERRNLKILTNTLVVKLLIKNETTYGVQYVNNGTSYCVKALKEVILSGGVINSPQLLMLSGIGPKDHLQQFNIPLVKDLPGVGSNMWDHIYFYIQPCTTNYTFKDVPKREAIRRYLDGKGSLTTPNNVQDVAFANLYSQDKSRPDTELIFMAMKMSNTSYEFYKQAQYFSEDIYKYVFKPLVGQNTWYVNTVLLHPKSRGSVRLQSNSPFEFPLIDPNYFSDPEGDDLNTLIAAFKQIEKITETPIMQKYDSKIFKINIPACKNYSFGSDDYIGCLIKNLASTISHFSGTCKMGPRNDSQAVVDNHLRVYGVKNLRVADCSIIPVSISGHTNAAAFMIGEKLGDLVKEDYGENKRRYGDDFW